MGEILVHRAPPVSRYFLEAFGGPGKGSYGFVKLFLVYPHMLADPFCPCKVA